MKFSAYLCLLFVLCIGMVTVARPCYANSTTLTKTDSLRALVEKELYTNPGRSIVLLKELEQEAIRRGDIYHQGYTQTKMLWYYYPRFDNDSLFLMAAKAEPFLRKHKLYDFLFNVQQTVVQRYANEGKYDKAVSKANQMMEEAAVLNNPLYMARAASALGTIYLHQKQYDKTIDFLSKSLSLLQQTEEGSVAGLALDNYITLARMLLRQENYEEALLYADSARSVIDRRAQQMHTNDREDAFIAEYVSAECYVALRQQAAAELHIERMEHYYSAGYPATFNMLRNQLYKNYYMLLEDYRKAYIYNEANIEFLRSGQQTSALPGVLQSKGDLLMLLGRAGEAARAYKEAYEQLQEHTHSEHARQLSELHTQYEVNKLEMQAREDQLRLNTSRRVTLAVAVVAVLLIVLLVMMYRNARRMHNKNVKLVHRIQTLDLLTQEKESLAQEVEQLKALLKIPVPESNIQAMKEDNQVMAALKQLMTKDKIYTDTALSIKQVCDKLSISEAHLRRILKTYYESTYPEYIAGLRAAHAQTILSNPRNRETIENVGFLSGFGSRTTFYRQFREIYGLSPDEYRRIIYSK